jgi:hypothetical protein
MLWLVNSGRYDSAFRPDGLLKVESDVVTNVIRLQNVSFLRDFEPP